MRADARGMPAAQQQQHSRTAAAAERGWDDSFRILGFYALVWDSRIDEGGDEDMKMHLFLYKKNI